MAKIVTVNGIVGAGKSTFINHFSSYLQENKSLRVYNCYEYVEGNQLLPLMYTEPKRWCYTSQTQFIVDKMKSFRKAKDSVDYDVVLIERGYDEMMIFVNVQHRLGYLSSIEYNCYRDLWREFKEVIPTHYTVNIHIPLEESLRRISLRGRPYESSHDEYFRMLYEGYESYYRDYTNGITIEDSLSTQSYEDLCQKLSF